MQNSSKNFMEGKQGAPKPAHFNLQSEIDVLVVSRICHQILRLNLRYQCSKQFIQNWILARAVARISWARKRNVRNLWFSAIGIFFENIQFEFLSLVGPLWLWARKHCLPCLHHRYGPDPGTLKFRWRVLQTTPLEINH